jgi:hypothetical protein
MPRKKTGTESAAVSLPPGYRTCEQCLAPKVIKTHFPKVIDTPLCNECLRMNELQAKKVYKCRLKCGRGPHLSFDTKAARNNHEKTQCKGTRPAHRLEDLDPDGSDDDPIAQLLQGTRKRGKPSNEMKEDEGDRVPPAFVDDASHTANSIPSPSLSQAQAQPQPLLKCPDCNLSLASTTLVKLHEKTPCAQKKNAVPHSCKSCAKTFDTAELLREHEEEEHGTTSLQRKYYAFSTTMKVSLDYRDQDEAVMTELFDVWEPKEERQDAGVKRTREEMTKAREESSEKLEKERGEAFERLKNGAFKGFTPYKPKNYATQLSQWKKAIMDYYFYYDLDKAEADKLEAYEATVKYTVELNLKKKLKQELESRAEGGEKGAALTATQKAFNIKKEMAATKK